jgi:(E)-4-hydroxy-3-methylbut-2-enyl-diphosphate synthase
VRGEVRKTVAESEIVATLLEEARRLAEQAGASAGGRPVVTVR